MTECDSSTSASTCSGSVSAERRKRSSSPAATCSRAATQHDDMLPLDLTKPKRPRQDCAAPVRSPDLKCAAASDGNVARERCPDVAEHFIRSLGARVWHELQQKTGQAA